MNKLGLAVTGKKSAKQKELGKFQASVPKSLTIWLNILYVYTTMKDIYVTNHIVHRTHQYSPDVQNPLTVPLLGPLFALPAHYTHTINITMKHTHTKPPEGMVFCPQTAKNIYLETLLSSLTPTLSFCVHRACEYS